jgi:hypothetical protein
MSAVPQKKLCWNCDGNIPREVDNCPYCRVYLHATELEEDSSWNPTYRFSKTEEIPSPLYQAQSEYEEAREQEDTLSLVQNNTGQRDQTEDVLMWSVTFAQLKRDVFPLLFLMMGSVFFLFGVVLLLFSQNGTLTLQWQGSDAFYFLLFALPLIGFGWKFLQQLDSDD